MPGIPWHKVIREGILRLQEMIVLEWIYHLQPVLPPQPVLSGRAKTYTLY